MSAPITLSQDIMTVQQIEVIVRQLEMHARRLRIGGTKNASLEDDAVRFIEHNNLKTDQPTDIQAALDALKELERIQPTIIMKSAQTLNDEFLRQLSVWFRNLIGPSVLLNVRVDHSLLAGITVQTPENFYDFSLSSGLMRGREYLHRLVAKA